MAEIQARIEADKKMLEGKRDMAVEEKKKVEENLQLHEAELNRAKEEQEALHQRLEALEKKVIVGGVNLLEKQEEQAAMLEEAQTELEERLVKEQDLAKALEEKEAERIDIEERYNSLQEEATGKTKKLKKLWNMIQNVNAEIEDENVDHQRQMEELLESIRQLSNDLKLAKLLIDAAIPPEYQQLIERNMVWNEEVADVQLRCVAYTGNNMRKKQQMLEESNRKKKEKEDSIKNLIGKGKRSKAVDKVDMSSDLSNVYLAYSQDSVTRAVVNSATAERAAAKSKSAKSRNKPR